MKTITFVFALIAAAGLVLPAQAQVGASTAGSTGAALSSAGGADLQSNAEVTGLTIDLGPVVIRPHLGVWLTYNDNVYFEATDEVDDYAWTVSPGLSAIYGNSGHNYLSAAYDYQTVHYFDETAADYDSHIISANAHYEAPRTTYHVYDSYTDTQVDSTETSEEVERMQNILGASVERFISSKTSAEVNGGYTTTDYERDDYVDYDEYRVGGRFYYRVRPKTDVFADAAYGWVDLKPLPADVNADLSDRFDIAIDDSYGDAEYEEVSAGVRGQLGAKTKATGRVGYQHRTFDEGDQIEEIDTWIASFGMETRLTSRMSGGMTASRRIFPWTTVPGNSAVATTVSPYLRRQLWRNRVSLAGSASYEWVDYYEASGETAREDEYLSATVLLDWRMRQNLTLGAGYTYAQNESTENDYNAERNLFLVRAMYNY